jgi:type II secretion system protein C
MQESAITLTLTGTLAAREPTQGLAILSDPKGGTHLWRVGAALPGHVQLRAVYADHVVIDRAGVLETLRLPRTWSRKGSDAGELASAPVAAAPNALARADGLVPTDPRAFSAARHWFAGVNAQRVINDGRFEGLRLQPMQRYKRQYGLRDGDVLKAINGVQLSDPDEAARQLQYSGSGVVTMAIERDGAVQEVSVDPSYH